MTTEHHPPAPTDDLGELISRRLRAGVELADHVEGTVVLRAGREAYTLRIVDGRPALAVGADTDPTTTVVAPPTTMRGVVAGKRSGVAAFLDGELRVRGNLALSLRLSGMWEHDARPAHFPVAGDVVADGQRTFLLAAGEGPPVVLLHGLGATNASMLPTLRDLATDHRVLAPDLPGFGDSDKPIRALHAAWYADWLLALLDATGTDTVHLVGNSMGGRVAIELALRHPDRVGRLALLAPSPAFLRRRDWVRLVAFLQPELAVLPLPIPRFMVQRGLRSLFARPERLDEAWYDAAVDEFIRVFSTVRGRIAFFSAARQIYLEHPHDKPGGFWSRLPELQPPSLFVWGQQDRLVPAAFATHVADALPDAEQVILEDCGHVPQYELPDTTAELVRDFLTT